jgi:hypothetical protein
MPAAGLPRPSIPSGAGGKGDRGGCVTAFTFAMPGPRHKTPAAALRRARESLETEMRMILLVFSLVALAVPAYAAQKPSLEKKCHELVGREDREGEGGRSHVGQLQVQRFSDCMMGLPY